MEGIEDMIDSIKLTIQKHKDRSNNASVDKTTMTKIDCDKIIEAIKDLAKIVEKHRDMDFTQLIRDKIGILKSLRDIMVSERFTSNYDEELVRIFNKLYNRIYIAMNYNKIAKERQMFVTKTFTEFSKGITYFSKDKQEGRHPSYHRNASCGSERLTSERKFSRTRYGPKMHKAIEFCLIERLLYDQIFRHVIGYQDLGHSHELETVRRIYDSYYPENNLKIEVAYLQNKPFIIKIVYNNNLDERYTKTIKQDGTYDNNVDCKRQENGELYVKTQSFDSEEKWMRTNSVL